MIKEHSYLYLTSLYLIKIKNYKPGKAPESAKLNAPHYLMANPDSVT